MSHTLPDAARTALASLLHVAICVICGRPVDAALGINVAAMHTTCVRPARTITPPASISPTDRARVRQRLAYLLGEGLAVTRADVLTELHTTPAAGGITPRDISVTLVTRGVANATPAVTPDPTPDAPVSFAAAADRLGVSVATVKRYAAPSSGKLARLGDGVGQASVEALAATR